MCSTMWIVGAALTWQHQVPEIAESQQSDSIMKQQRGRLSQVSCAEQLRAQVQHAQIGLSLHWARIDTCSKYTFGLHWKWEVFTLGWQ